MVAALAIAYRLILGQVHDLVSSRAAGAAGCLVNHRLAAPSLLRCGPQRDLQATAPREQGKLGISLNPLCALAPPLVGLGKPSPMSHPRLPDLADRIIAPEV